MELITSFKLTSEDIEDLVYAINVTLSSEGSKNSTRISRLKALHNILLNNSNHFQRDKELKKKFN
ncbi:MAG: hypothetical protein H0Z32_13940 [Bacillaceae bacterium]|nr:hypothetical protein [Bacillaceae bacterium]